MLFLWHKIRCSLLKFVIGKNCNQGNCQLISYGGHKSSVNEEKSIECLTMAQQAGNHNRFKGCTDIHYADVKWITGWFNLYCFPGSVLQFKPIFLLLTEDLEGTKLESQQDLKRFIRYSLRHRTYVHKEARENR